MPLAKTTMMPHLPRSSIFSTSFSICEWKPLTTATSSRWQISVAQSSVGSTESVAIASTHCKRRKLSWNSGMIQISTTDGAARAEAKFTWIMSSRDRGRRSQRLFQCYRTSQGDTSQFTWCYHWTCGTTKPHVGTGGGGSTSELPWGEQKEQAYKSKIGR